MNPSKIQTWILSYTNSFKGESHQAKIPSEINPFWKEFLPYRSSCYEGIPIHTEGIHNEGIQTEGIPSNSQKFNSKKYSLLYTELLKFG